MSLLLNLQHNVPALDISSEIPTGKIIALVGASGSGKTSILRAVAGLLNTKHAHICFDGERWSDSKNKYHMPTHLRPIGFVSQSYALFPHLTVLENVETSLMHLSPQERKSQAHDCLELTHIKGFEARYPNELSGGQKQRVALARAIARKPKILLLDEPFSAVDRTTRKSLYIELQQLHERLGITIILVTHDINEAIKLASYLMLISQGRQLQAGPMADVLNQPCCEEAELLLAERY